MQLVQICFGWDMAVMYERLVPVPTVSLRGSR